MLDDGARPYPKAIDCLVQLRAAVKRTAINRARRAEIGIDDSLYDAIVTSGEATWQAFAERPEPFFAALGGRCFLWSRCGDRSVVDGLPLEAVERVENAEFVLLGGVEDDARLEDFSAHLEAAADRGAPRGCANPDAVAVLPDGCFGMGMGPGAVAHRHEQLGRAVRYGRQAAPPDLTVVPRGAR